MGEILLPAKMRGMTTTEGQTFPRQSARTGNFRLGAPRQVSVSRDGERIVFVRSLSGTDPVNRLVVVDTNELTERIVADPTKLLADSEELPAAERARRERMRESTSGVTSYSCDSDATHAAFALSGRLFVADLTAGATSPVRELAAATPAVDPRLSPDGSFVSYVHDRALRVINVATGDDRALCEPESTTITYGLADFIAAEELDRIRGQWWSPDSTTLLVERFDEAPVATWWISNPAAPSIEPTPHRYPAAGTANAEVSLQLVRLSGERTDVVWDQTYPYLASVSWSSHGPALIQVLSRNQQRGLILSIDPVDGTTSTLHAQDDPTWVDVIPGLPCWTSDGRLVRTVDDAATDTRRLCVGDALVTPPGIQVMGVLASDESGVVLIATDDPTERRVYRVGLNDTLTPLTPDGGLRSVTSGGPTTVVSSTSLGEVSTTWTITRQGVEVGHLTSFAERPTIIPAVTLLRAGERDIVTAVLFPTAHVHGSKRLPVIMAPYGGPHHSEVLASGLAFASDQWLADQGFAVIVADGRGTPGRGPAWERAVMRDFAGPILDDQIAALTAVSEAFPDDIDTSRVGITGWSFGGWLAGLAVLARPDVFHAAVAGAPVTEWRLYDTAYTERYLGNPHDEPDVYDRQSLVALAPGLQRPLMIIHGLADDNVVVANTLALSGALLAAGRPHTVLPLTGVTHMASSETVAENLLLLQVEFLRSALTSP